MVDVRRHWRGVTVELERQTCPCFAWHCARTCERRARVARPPPRPRSGVHGHRDGRRSDREQLRRHALRCRARLLPDRSLAHVRAAVGHDDRHGRNPVPRQVFAEREPELAHGLAQIRDEIRADPALAERIRRKFEIKNTTGYRLVAFLDADEPLEIFRRLLVGSEGTLGFVSEAVFETVVFGKHVTTAFVIFPTIDDAVACVQPLVEAGASATELMMVLSMKVAQAFVSIPPEWNDAPRRREPRSWWSFARATSRPRWRHREARALEVLAGRPMVQPARFTRDPELTEIYWRVREGLHGLLGKLRPRGTSLMIEDVCVPPARIAEAAADVRELLAGHGFLPGVAGHASAGNLHFMLTPTFTDPGDRDRYEAFMGDLVDLIVDKYDGSLKAEHGTGLNMAPYVEREWGTKATEICGASRRWQTRRASWRRECC